MDAFKVLEDIANDSNIDPQIRINACVQIIAQKRQEKYDARDLTAELLSFGGEENNEFKEKLEKLEQDVADCLDLFRLISDR